MKRVFTFLSTINWSTWLPTRGNVLFTTLVVAILVSTQGVWAKNTDPSLSHIGTNATTVNYQGRLADNADLPLTGTYNITFTIYDALSGGAALWSENHTNVQISSGLFNVALGSLTPLPLNLWGNDRFLEMTVNGETLTPREPIRSVPTSGMALTVPDGAIGEKQIANGAITLSKLGGTANLLPLDGSITTLKIADGAVTNKQIQLSFFSGKAVEGTNIGTSSTTFLTLPVNVPYSATYLVVLNVTTMSNQVGSRDQIYINCDGTSIGKIDIIHSIAGASGTSSESFSKLYSFTTGGLHTITITGSISGTGGTIRSAEIYAVPFFATP